MVEINLRRCRLLEQYSKLTWLTACPIRKSLHCTEENARIGHMRRSSGSYECFEIFPYTVALASVTCERNISVVGSFLDQFSVVLFLSVCCFMDLCGLV